MVFFTLMILLSSTSVPASLASRPGPCPGLALDSCECFAILTARVKRVIWTPDMVNRNWNIILMYQDLSHAFQVLLGTSPGAKDPQGGFYPSVIPWPGIAAWASNAVGYGIRKQFLNDAFGYWDRNLTSAERDFVDFEVDQLDAFFEKLLTEISVALGNGNQAVIQQIGLSFTGFGNVFCNISRNSGGNIDTMQSFIETQVCTDGCSLAQALWALYWVRYNESLSFHEKDQWMLVSNALVGLQEQTLLQPYLNASMPPICIGPVCLPASFTQYFMTEVFLFLLVGDHRMNVSVDVPSNIHAGQPFSIYLDPVNLTLPKAIATMEQMLGRTSPLSLQGTAAQNWVYLSQRMKYIAPLFWAFQDTPHPNCYIYNETTEEAIRANRTEPLSYLAYDYLCQYDCCKQNGGWQGL